MSKVPCEKCGHPRPTEGIGDGEIGSLLRERDSYLDALEAFLDPERYGWSVSEEVRNHVRRALGIPPVPIK